MPQPLSRVHWPRLFDKGVARIESVVCTHTQYLNRPMSAKIIDPAKKSFSFALLLALIGFSNFSDAAHPSNNDNQSAPLIIRLKNLMYNENLENASNVASTLGVDLQPIEQQQIQSDHQRPNSKTAQSYRFVFRSNELIKNPLIIDGYSKTISDSGKVKITILIPINFNNTCIKESEIKSSFGENLHRLRGVRDGKYFDYVNVGGRDREIVFLKAFDSECIEQIYIFQNQSEDRK
ncbi:hypothetical protein [Burkholderia ubonensis]|uniref:hypothetical protein n=1 Tax=Burkholderia ubonensis TaxID=101571 RepID=UPI0012F761B8|nr:hypothetical protein [Burkholderia ubonensis]